MDFELKYKAVFLAHGGARIGMGHILRCLSLARQFRRESFEVKFISKYPEGISCIQENGFAVCSIPNTDSACTGFEYGTEKELEKDLFYIEGILKKEMPSILIVDSYLVNCSFFEQIKRYTNKLVYIDDIYAFDYPVDCIINGNITGEHMNYKKVLPEQEFLLGLPFNLIREEFQNLPERTAEKYPKSILITTGGADPEHVTLKIIQILSQIPIINDMKLHVVIGAAFQPSYIQELEESTKKHTKINYYKTPKSMSELMQKSDFAISAGGSTIYELFACGVIPFAFCYAENQRMLLNLAEEKGCLYQLGGYEELNLETMQDLLEKVYFNYPLRKQMVKKIQSMVDGRGTHRIVEFMKLFLLN